MMIRLASGLGAAALLLMGCSNDGNGSDGASALKWYSTCGDPVCRIPEEAGTVDSGVSMCTAEQAAGQPCTIAGATCGDPEHNCGSVMVCTDHDPKAGGCPISSRRFKKDISYLSSHDLEAITDSLLKLRLATFRYKEGDAARHLGFIIEDSPDVPASDMARARVDLYAYTSMAVAALQLQARQIQQLEADVDALSNEVEALTGKRRMPPLSCSPRASQGIAENP